MFFGLFFNHKKNFPSQEEFFMLQLNTTVKVSHNSWRQPSHKAHWSKEYFLAS